MKLSKLRQKMIEFANLPDDTEIVTAGNDHSYNRATNLTSLPAREDDGDFYEADPRAEPGSPYAANATIILVF